MPKADGCLPACLLTPGPGQGHSISSPPATHRGERGFYHQESFQSSPPGLWRTGLGSPTGQPGSPGVHLSREPPGLGDSSRQTQSVQRRVRVQADRHLPLPPLSQEGEAGLQGTPCLHASSSNTGGATLCPREPSSRAIPGKQRGPGHACMHAGRPTHQLPAPRRPAPVTSSLSVSPESPSSTAGNGQNPPAAAPGSRTCPAWLWLDKGARPARSAASQPLTRRPRPAARRRFRFHRRPPALDSAVAQRPRALGGPNCGPGLGGVASSSWKSRFALLAWRVVA